MRGRGCEVGDLVTELQRTEEYLNTDKKAV